MSSPSFATFAPLQLAPWNNAVNEKITLLWNTASTEVELFAYSTIPQGELSFFGNPGLIALDALRFAAYCLLSYLVCPFAFLLFPFYLLSALRYAPA